MDVTKAGKWSLTNLPPAGDKDVGKFFYQKVKEGNDEKARLGLEDRWTYNHRMFRGDHWGEGLGARTSKKHLTMNLLFANIQRTIANLTAKQPVVEAIEVGDEFNTEKTDKILTAWLHKWWSDTNQADSMVDSAHEMEIYGPTIEKYIFTDTPDTVVIDPFAFGKAPGIFDDVQDIPYIYHKAIMRTDEVEQFYGLEAGTIKANETYTEFGEDREEHTPRPTVKAGSLATVSAYERNRRNAASKDREMAVVTEIWVKDYSGNYEDNIRVVTIANDGEIVLSDTNNPNVNWALFEKDPSLVVDTFLFGKYPFTIGNSYKDKTTNWGFSALEQTADINEVIDELVSRLYAYVAKSLLPVLIVPKDTGVKITQINNRPGLVLQPNTSTQAGAIRYMDPPRVSLDIYKYIDLLRGFFDQVWHIEDADRGERPSGVIAAQAIQALQERNAVLMRAKIRTIDTLIENRGRAAISFLQNFGTKNEIIRIEDEVTSFKGLNLAGKKYKFIVESGSTVHKTTMQVQQQSIELYRMGAIDRQGLLETVDFPGWKQVIERVGENQLDQAMQILIDAGMEENEAAQLKQYLLQKQRSPEDDKSKSGSKSA